MVNQKLEVLPCPFCAGVKLDGLDMMDGRSEKDSKYWLYCRSCGAAGPESATEEEALKKWNRRRP